MLATRSLARARALCAAVRSPLRAPTRARSECSYNNDVGTRENERWGTFGALVVVSVGTGIGTWLFTSSGYNAELRRDMQRLLEKVEKVSQESAHIKARIDEAHDRRWLSWPSQRKPDVGAPA